MASRQVTGTGKDRTGDIVSLCGAWGTVSAATAISDITYRLNTYHVLLTNGKQAEVEVVNGAGGKYLQSNWDGTTANNLDRLKDC